MFDAALGAAERADDPVLISAALDALGLDAGDGRALREDA